MSKSNRVSDTENYLKTENKFWTLYLIILAEACVIAFLCLPEYIG